MYVSWMCEERKEEKKNNSKITKLDFHGFIFIHYSFIWHCRWISFDSDRLWSPWICYDRKRLGVIAKESQHKIIVLSIHCIRYRYYNSNETQTNCNQLQLKKHPSTWYSELVQSFVVVYMCFETTRKKTAFTFFTNEEPKKKTKSRTMKHKVNFDRLPQTSMCTTNTHQLIAYVSGVSFNSIWRFKYAYMQICLWIPKNIHSLMRYKIKRCSVSLYVDVHTHTHTHTLRAVWAKDKNRLLYFPLLGVKANMLLVLMIFLFHFACRNAFAINKQQF